MAQYGWDNCPGEVRQQVESFTADAAALLDGCLIGVYLHGSLALGCFNPARSDLDLLVVISERLTPGRRGDLARLSLRYSSNPCPLEWSVVRDKVLHPWQYPTPYEFHFSESWRDPMERALTGKEWPWGTGDESPADPDLAAHVMMVRQRGLCLIGQPIVTAIPQVPRDDMVDSLRRDVEWLLAGLPENPVYGVLNLCRVYRYLVENHVSSKDEGAVWALAHLPPAMRPIIVQALALYRGQVHSVVFDVQTLSLFADTVGQQIFRLMESSREHRHE